jgi:hypothetical protein
MDLERIGDISRYPKLLPPNPDHIWCIWCWRNLEKGLLPRCEYLVCCNLRHGEPVMCMVGTVYSVLYSGATWFVTASYHPKWKGSIQFDRMPQASFLSIIVALLGRFGTGSGQGSPLSTGNWELYELSALNWMNPVSTEANQSATSFLNWPDTALNARLHPIDSTFPLPCLPTVYEWSMDWWDGSLDVLHFLWPGPPGPHPQSVGPLARFEGASSAAFHLSTSCNELCCKLLK